MKEGGKIKSRHRGREGREAGREFFREQCDEGVKAGRPTLNGQPIDPV